MPRDDGRRNFALREDDQETSTYSGKTPRQAALKAARRLDPGATEEEAPAHELRLREKGTSKVHIYEGWAWKDEPPEVNPTEWEDQEPWLSDLDEITKAKVYKQGIEYLDD